MDETVAGLCLARFAACEVYRAIIRFTVSTRQYAVWAFPAVWLGTKDLSDKPDCAAVLVGHRLP